MTHCVEELREILSISAEGSTLPTTLRELGTKREIEYLYIESIPTLNLFVLQEQNSKRECNRREIYRPKLYVV